MATLKDLKRQVELSRKIGRSPQVVGICKRLKVLKESGMENYEIESVIKQMNLPLGLHIFIMGNFSDLMELRYV